MTLGYLSASPVDSAQQALKTAGADQLKQAAASLGLPPDIANLASGLLSGKGGVEGTLKSGFDAAQGLINQISGPLGGPASQLTGAVTKALGIKPSALSKAFGTGGAAVGTAILGPIGAVAGQFLGTLIGGGLKALVSGSVGAREEGRRLSDLRRLAVILDKKKLPFNRKCNGIECLNFVMSMKDLEAWHKLFLEGNVALTLGKKGETPSRWRMKSGKLQHIDRPEWDAMLKRDGHKYPETFMYFDSYAGSHNFLTRMLAFENYLRDQVEKLQQAQAVLQRAKEIEEQKKKDSATAARLTKLEHALKAAAKKHAPAALKPAHRADDVKKIRALEDAAKKLQARLIKERKLSAKQVQATVAAAVKKAVAKMQLPVTVQPSAAPITGSAMPQQPVFNIVLQPAQYAQPQYAPTPQYAMSPASQYTASPSVMLPPSPEQSQLDRDAASAYFNL